MGQYFIAVNKTKKEYFNAWEVGGVAKLWEWCVGLQAGLFPYLLRKSSGEGGGDVRIDSPKFAGRWAGDKVYLVGDYDSSDLYRKAEKSYTNIAKPLVEEYNNFIEVKERQLTYSPME